MNSMHSTTFKVAAIVHIYQFLLITASAQGPCSKLIPGQFPNQEPNVEIDIKNIIDDEYMPGINYTITLRGIDSDYKFREFIIQAKSADSNSSVGSFWTKPSRKRKYKPACIRNTGAINFNGKKKKLVQLQWTAPPAGTGPIRFWFSSEKVDDVWAVTTSGVIQEFKECSVEGQERRRCAYIPENCTRTCDNKDKPIQCSMNCSINGCHCPEGMVVNTLINRCVPPQTCPAKCPIEGQIRRRCAIPENCTQTCDNRDEPMQCSMDCNFTGCYCPEGMVVNTLINRCVVTQGCPPKCPIRGQIRKRCAKCTPTCENKKKPIRCPQDCNPYGCECPNGLVVNNITKECVEPNECPPIQGCPPKCSHQQCSQKKKNVKCSIPDDSGHDTTCLDNCNTAFCAATYYSNEVRMPSQSCTPCNDPTDLDCLHDWSKCVKKKDKATYGSSKKNPENFKYYIHPCRPIIKKRLLI